MRTKTKVKTMKKTKAPEAKVPTLQGLMRLKKTRTPRELMVMESVAGTLFYRVLLSKSGDEEKLMALNFFVDGQIMNLIDSLSDATLHKMAEGKWDISLADSADEELERRARREKAS